MEHTMKSEKFSVAISPKIFNKDLEYLTNTILNVTVQSSGFSANAEMDIEIEEFAVFSEILKNIYDTLKGEAIITEPYGDMYISFKGDGKGYIYVEGYLHNFNDLCGMQELRFENRFDQTYLKDFANDLYNSYKEYLPKSE